VSVAPARPAPGRRIYRRHEHRFVLAVLELMVASVFVAPLLGAGPDHVGPGDAVALALLAAPWLVLAWRTLRLGVIVRPEGIVVRNVLHTRRVPWADIERFALGTWRGPGGFACGVARLRDGGRVTLTALNPPLGDLGAVPRLLDGLNDELERATGRRG
jgi:hypothetical protein